MKKVLTSWVGFTDIRASKGEEKDGYGPVCQAVQERTFDEINLISDLPHKDTDKHIPLKIVDIFQPKAVIPGVKTYGSL